VTATTQVYLEVGKKWTFACALDWPGWCRRGRDTTTAIEALISYIPRYAIAAGPGFAPGDVEVIGELPGNASTDFGVPAAVGDWDRVMLEPVEADLLAGRLERTWKAFDAVVAVAPASLRKGPRGGGRDRDAIVDHVREAERSYGRKLGVTVAPRTPWADQRTLFLNALRGGDLGGAWPARYSVRRIGWHVMDHAWEIEDRSQAE
jgi:hypothetical protein